MSAGASFVSRRLVIFDFDGTLADTKAGIVSTATTVLGAWGVPEADLSPERVGQLIGPPFPQAFETVFGLSQEDAVEVTRRYRDIYTKLGVEAWPAFAGVPELLGELHAAGRMLAVASSKRTPLVRRGLADNGIEGLFDLVVARDHDGETSKADAIRQALAHAEAQPAEAVMVGDRHHDVDAAMEAGVDCIGVLYGNTASREELVGAGAVAVAQTVDELGRLLLG